MLRPIFKLPTELPLTYRGNGCMTHWRKIGRYFTGGHRCKRGMRKESFPIRAMNEQDYAFSMAIIVVYYKGWDRAHTEKLEAFPVCSTDAGGRIHLTYDFSN